MLNKRILVLIFLLVFLPLVGCFPSPAPPITENQAPIITSIPITSVTVGETYVYDVEATDPDGDTLAYSLSTKPTGMTIDPATGLIKWTPKAKGNYAVTVKVSDGALSDTQSFTIVVSKPSAPPPVNHAPIITSIPDLATIVGIQYIYEVKATDPDGDVLTYSLTVKPDGMAIDSTTGTVSWIPSLDQIGSNPVTVQASDGKKATTQSFMITVEAVELTGIEVNPKTMTLFVRESKPIISVTAYYDDGSTANIALEDCAYLSDDEVVATVLAGVISALTPGSATITVSYGGETDTLEVTVNSILLTSIVVLPEEMTFFVGDDPETIKSVTTHYSDGSTKDIALGDCTYDSSDTEVAEVDASGKVTANAYGETTITVSYTEEEITKTVLIEETDTIEVKVIDRVHNIDADKYYDEIQTAIDEALAGDTITVAAGTYEENVTIDESVTLQGEDRETTEIIWGYGIYPSEPPLIISAYGVTVSGFTIHSGPYIEAAFGSPNGWAFTIIVDGDSALLTDLHVIKDLLLTYNDNPREGGSAFWLAPSLDGFTLTDSIVESEWNGIYAREEGSDIIVRNVDFTYLGTYAIMLKQITGATIEDNIFTNTSNELGLLVSRGCEGIEIIDNEFTGSTSSESSHIGILLQDFKTGPVVVSILGNDISDFDTGIKVEENVATSGISIHDNNIYDNFSYGVNNLGLDTVNAEDNWWGDESGPTHPSNLGGTGDIVSDNVDFDPWSKNPH